jgi:3,8-divinyl chlorophyllide a/chlorophyllide a reductase subunit Y
LIAHGAHVQFRAALEQDLAAVREVKPDFAIGTTPVVQKAKESGIPAVYFTNIMSSRPLFGIPGTAALASSIAAQTRGRERFARMVSFFGTVPKPAAEVVPVDAPAAINSLAASMGT